VSEIKQNYKFIVLFSLIFVLYLFLMHKNGHGDIGFWQSWSIYIFENGLGHVYYSGSDYPPLYYYFLWFFGKYQGSIELITENIHFVKAFTLIFDFITVYVLFKIIRKKRDNNYEVFTLSLFYLLNIGVIYNTLIWGQVDSILACFIFLSFYHAHKTNILWSIIFYLLAINFKLQAIIFLPFIGLLLMPSLVKKFTYSRLALWIIIPFALQVVILMPFIVDGSVSKIWEVATGSVGKFPAVSMSAYNMWFYFLNGNLTKVNDSATFIGVSYNKIGLLLFFAASFFALFPLLKESCKAIKESAIFQINIERALLIGGLIPLLFFYFNTQMHERYSHPALIFIISYCIMRSNFFILFLISAAYFLNLEAVLKFFNLRNYETVIFSPVFISSLFLITILWLYKELYFFDKLNKSEKE
jgi:Gpi18-like mannosyltransferase